MVQFVRVTHSHWDVCIVTSVGWGQATTCLIVSRFLRRWRRIPALHSYRYKYALTYSIIYDLTHFGETLVWKVAKLHILRDILQGWGTVTTKRRALRWYIGNSIWYPLYEIPPHFSVNIGFTFLIPFGAALDWNFDFGVKIVILLVCYLFENLTPWWQFVLNDLHCNGVTILNVYSILPNNSIQVWSLHGLTLIADCGGPMFRSFVDQALYTAINLLLQTPSSLTQVHQCLGKCFGALITAIGPELQGIYFILFHHPHDERFCVVIIKKSIRKTFAFDCCQRWNKGS